MFPCQLLTRQIERFTGIGKRATRGDLPLVQQYRGLPAAAAEMPGGHVVQRRRRFRVLTKQSFGGQFRFGAAPELRQQDEAVEFGVEAARCQAAGPLESAQCLVSRVPIALALGPQGNGA